MRSGNLLFCHSPSYEHEKKKYICCRAVEFVFSRPRFPILWQGLFGHNEHVVISWHLYGVCLVKSISNNHRVLGIHREPHLSVDFSYGRRIQSCEIICKT